MSFLKKSIITSFIILLNVPATFNQVQSISITNEADSVSIYNEGKLIAKLIWPQNPISGQNDFIDVSLNSSYLLPPAAGGFNCSLNKPLHISLRTLSEISFNWGVRLRLYIDTAEFKVEEIINHINIYQVPDNDTVYTKLNYSPPMHGPDYVEFEVLNIADDQNYLVIGFNFLFGAFNASQLSEQISSEILVPPGKELILNGGISLTTTNYSRMVVGGKLKCNGTEFQPINFNDVGLDIWGKHDSIFSNNSLFETECSYTNVKFVNQYYANSTFRNCIFKQIRISGYSTSNITDTRLLGGSFDKSKVWMNNCQFDSGGYCNTGYSIVEIKNSLVKLITQEFRFSNSFINLKNNTIYTGDYSSAIVFNRSVAFAEGNKLFYTKNDHEKDGFSVYNGSFAVIFRNIFRGLNVAMRCTSEDTLVAYNNTFLENNQGFNTGSNPNRMSFFNNIFYMQLGWAVNLDFNSMGYGVNIAYTDSNLCYQGRPYFVNYINDPQDSSIVIGNSEPIIADPEFTDLENCYLNASSPAIDRGLKKIYSFGHLSTVLDTVIIIPDSITIGSYSGLLPDLGAKEYSGPDDVTEQGFKPITYMLYQNFPNPFNPATLIRWQIPENEFVTIKVYDILGREVSTLVNEERTAGIYNVKFNGSNLSSGIYICMLKCGNFMDIKKMMLMK